MQRSPSHYLGLSLAVIAIAFSLALGSEALRRSLAVPSETGSAYNEGAGGSLAPRERCPGSEDLSASPEALERTILCLLNWARVHQGLRPLSAEPLLMRSAELKARDIVRCADFRHDACGKPGNDGARRVGYVGPGVSFGENIAWGTAVAGSPRAIVGGWLDSPSHRENLFRARWTEQGAALVVAEGFEGEPDVRIWVSHFGRRGR